MADDEQTLGEFDDILSELRRRVEQRRRAGDYPDGLEEDLDQHFRRIEQSRGGSITSEQLEQAIEMVRATAQFGRHRIKSDSRLPGGELAHRTMSKALSRQLDGVFHQMREFADTVKGALELLTDAVEDPPRHVHADILGPLYAVEERLAAIERRLALDLDPYAKLSARLDELEDRLGARAFVPPFTSAAFEAAFRGDTDELTERYRALADRLVGDGPVLDIGCGRGELLALLRERGVAAEGVELDSELCREARAEGLVVHHADGLAHLAKLPERSLGAVVAVQVIEHLHPQQLVELMTLAFSRLRDGGKLLLETPNVQSLYVHGRAFWLDPTHVRFVHPGYLVFLAEQIGFRGIEMDTASPPPESDRLHPVPDDVPGASAINENIARLNRLLFEAQDVLVVATR